MAKLRLTVAAGDYDIVRPLKEGLVEAAGLELIFLTDMGPRERHWRLARKTEFDVCEENVGAYFIARDQNHPITAIPVFLHRRFRHGFVFINAAAGIKSPKDLIGKTIGGTNFMPAGNIWMRGVLEERYGLPHRTITWVTDRSEDIAFDAPADLRIEMKKTDKTRVKAIDVLDRVGDASAVPVLIAALEYLQTRRPAAGALGRKKDPRAAEPLMAWLPKDDTVRQEIVNKYPWVTTNLMKAFEQAKQLAYHRVRNPRMVPLAWVRTAVEEQEATLGKDPWEYGLTPANRKNLETVQRYVHQQGMVSKLRRLEELFDDTDLGDSVGLEEV